MESGESENQKRGAARDLIELARSIESQERKGNAAEKKVTFPAAQLRALKEAADEIGRQQEKFGKTSDGG